MNLQMQVVDVTDENAIVSVIEKVQVSHFKNTLFKLNYLLYSSNNCIIFNLIFTANSFLEKILKCMILEQVFALQYFKIDIIKCKCSNFCSYYWFECTTIFLCLQKKGKCFDTVEINIFYFSELQENRTNFPDSKLKT